MINLRSEDRNIRIKKIIPSNVEPEDVISIFSKYVDQALATGLASIYKSAIGNTEFVIFETESKVYELEFNYGGPRLKESKKFERLMTVLMTSGMNKETAFKCISEVFFAEENAEADRKEKLAEKARIDRIAKEMPTWMPKGYKYLTGNMYEGLVVVDQYGNQFTYVPYLEIYVSRYEISLDSEGYVSSLPDKKAWVNMKYKDAYEAATKFDPANKSDLLTSVEKIWEAIERKTEKKSTFHVVYDGTVEIRTGAIPENMRYNIDCLVGNHYCILKSANPGNRASAYGLSYIKEKYDFRCFPSSVTLDKPRKDVGFRICLRR